MGPDMDPGFRESYRGRENVFMTHPESREVGAVLSKTFTPEKGDALVIVASHHLSGDQSGDYVLKVKGNGRELLNVTIDSTSVDASGWARFEIPLDEFAGQETTLEIVNEPNGWSWEAAYLAQIAIEKK